MTLLPGINHKFARSVIADPVNMHNTESSFHMHGVNV